MTAVLWFVALGASLASLAACDSRASASDPGAGRRAALAREYESCASGADCEEPLRCVAAVCRRGARSTIGDFHAATGAAALARGDHEGAIAAYAAALAQYDGDKLALPPDVDCAYGAALVAGRANKRHAELAARVLHRCLLAVPAAGPLRDQALAQLVPLAEAGLDPRLLGAAKLADVYLALPAQPRTDDLRVSLTAAPAPAGKAFAAIAARVAEAELRPALIECWQAHAAAASPPVLVVPLAVKVVAVAGEYEDDPRTWTVRFEAPAAGPAETCVRAVVEPAVKGLRLADGFPATRATLTIE